MSSEQEQLDAAIAASLLDVELSHHGTAAPAPKQPANALLKQLAEERKQRLLKGERTHKTFLQPKQEAADLINSSYMSEEEQLLYALSLSVEEDSKIPAASTTPSRGRGNPQERPTPSPQKSSAGKVKGIIVRSDPESGTIYEGTMADKTIMREQMKKIGIKYQNITTIDSTQKATAPNVTMKDDILSSVKNSVKNNDHVVFSYTGHGAQGDGALALRRGQKLTPAEFYQTWVEAAKNADGSFSKKLTVTIDACFSGNWVEQAKLFIAENPQMKIEVVSASNGKMLSDAYDDGSAFTMNAAGLDGVNWNKSENRHTPVMLSYNMGEDAKLGFKKRGKDAVDDDGTLLSVAKYYSTTHLADTEMTKDNLVKWATRLKEEGFLEGAVISLNKGELSKKINRAETAKKKSLAKNVAREELTLTDEMSELRSIAKALGVDSSVGRSGTKQDLIDRINAASGGGMVDVVARTPPRPSRSVEANDAALARSLAFLDEGSSPPQSGVHQPYFDSSSRLADIQRQAKRYNINAGVGGRTGGTKDDLIERVNAAAHNGYDDDLSFMRRRTPSPPPARQYYDDSSSLSDLRDLARQYGVNAGVGGRSGGTKSDLAERVNRAAANGGYDRGDDFALPPSPPAVRERRRG
eukprot:CAMPEP_0182491500 /NCGR_PEP_ID=MMETSP1321-20130603/912_1 /TAXON_ID=91990 /ORGANISM="Bolidomonas sp., Strain RCC1657" /LENGTH=637 /DNA_ID=CAMNT_0024693781 /DNA_START=69 /DNA_END=1979 /DNA_ORIENTATION=-